MIFFYCAIAIGLAWDPLMKTRCMWTTFCTRRHSHPKYCQVQCLEPVVVCCSAGHAHCYLVVDLVGFKKPQDIGNEGLEFKDFCERAKELDLSPVHAFVIRLCKQAKCFWWHCWVCLIFNSP